MEWGRLKELEWIGEGNMSWGEGSKEAGEGMDVAVRILKAGVRRNGQLFDVADGGFTHTQALARKTSGNKTGSLVSECQHALPVTSDMQTALVRPLNPRL